MTKQEIIAGFKDKLRTEMVNLDRLMLELGRAYYDKSGGYIGDFEPWEVGTERSRVKNSYERIKFLQATIKEVEDTR